MHYLKWVNVLHDEEAEPSSPATEIYLFSGPNTGNFLGLEQITYCLPVIYLSY